jgi:hypothetical protein
MSIAILFLGEMCLNCVPKKCRLVLRANETLHRISFTKEIKRMYVHAACRYSVLRKSVCCNSAPTENGWSIVPKKSEFWHFIKRTIQQALFPAEKRIVSFNHYSCCSTIIKSWSGCYTGAGNNPANSKVICPPGRAEEKGALN